jgi:Spy/CpxP family protein refolding chaperone
MNQGRSGPSKSCSSSKVWPFALLALFWAPAALGQLPHQFWAWWNSPIVQNLNLTQEQRNEIRSTIRDYRPNLQKLRAEVEIAENELDFEFNQTHLDTRKANDAIERLSNARRDLTRTISQMSLRLRTILTQEQWQELQRRRPVRQPRP